MDHDARPLENRGARRDLRQHFAVRREVFDDLDRRRRMRRTPSGGSASAFWNQVSKARSMRSAAWSSAATSKSGSIPASTGRSRSKSPQNAWIVPIRASSRWDKAFANRSDLSGVTSFALRARSISARNRSFISPAAFSVKVTATMRSSVLTPSQIKATIRPTSAVVLPVPAAASTNNVVPKSVRIRRLASASANLCFRDSSWHVPQLEEGRELPLRFSTRSQLLVGAAHRLIVTPRTLPFGRCRRQKRLVECLPDDFRYLRDGISGLSI